MAEIKVLTHEEQNRIPECMSGCCNKCNKFGIKTPMVYILLCGFHLRICSKCMAKMLVEINKKRD